MIVIIVESKLIEDIEWILHVICFVCEERLFKVAVVVGCCQTNRILVLVGFHLAGSYSGNCCTAAAAELVVEMLSGELMSGMLSSQLMSGMPSGELMSGMLSSQLMSGMRSSQLMS